MNYVASIMDLFTAKKYILISFLGDYPGQIVEKKSLHVCLYRKTLTKKKTS